MPRILHGHRFTGRRSPEYQCWLDMKQRCQNPRNKHYDRYGGRGISICSRWLDGDGVSNGSEYMGGRPKGLTIDRIDNDGPYSPFNCRWATRARQVQNRSVTRRVALRGMEMAVTEACERLGINRKLVSSRIDRGLPAELAITHPLGKHFKKRVSR